MPSSVPRSAPYFSCSSYASFAVADGDGKGVGSADRSAHRSREEPINEVGVRVSWDSSSRLAPDFGLVVQDRV